jgi:hypothetical protein
MKSPDSQLAGAKRRGTDWSACMKNRHRVSQVVSKLILVTAAGARCFTVAANIAKMPELVRQPNKREPHRRAAGGEAGRQEIAARSIMMTVMQTTRLLGWMIAGLILLRPSRYVTRGTDRQFRQRYRSAGRL